VTNTCTIDALGELPSAVKYFGMLEVVKGVVGVVAWGLVWRPTNAALLTSHSYAVERR
jgi:hypothetical protein